MRRDLRIAAAMLAGSMIAAAAAPADTAPEVSLTRFDCGKTSTLNDVSRFSDVAAMKGLNVPFTFSCYLVKHGKDYLVWDTGNPPASGSAPAPAAPKVTLVEQLAQLHLQPFMRSTASSTSSTALAAIRALVVLHWVTR